MFHLAFTASVCIGLVGSVSVIKIATFSFSRSTTWPKSSHWNPDVYATFHRDDGCLDYFPIRFEVDEPVDSAICSIFLPPYGTASTSEPPPLELILVTLSE